MAYSLHNKVILLTGAAGGLGQALCQIFIEHGAKVIAIDINTKELSSLERRFNQTSFLGSCCDITDWKSCEQVVGQAIQTFGGIDIVLNNAGVTHFSRFWETEATLLNQIIDINLKGAINITRAAIDQVIARQGMIIGVSSVAGFSPLYARSAYSASKFGLSGLMDTLRAELREHQVNVLSVFPGFIQTQAIKREEGTQVTGLQRPGQASATPGKTLLPEEAAREIVNSIKNEKQTLLLGSLAKLAWLVSRLAPNLYEKIMMKQVRREISDN